MNTFNKRLIIIGSTLPFSFPTDYIKQTCMILSKSNKVIVFLWGEALSIKEIFLQKFNIKIFQHKKSLTLFTPIHFVPFKRFETIRNLNLALNVFLLKIYFVINNFKYEKKIVWIFNYELYKMPVFFGQNYFSIFDCVDYFSSIHQKTNKIIKVKVEYLIRNSKLFFVNSSSLAKLFSKYKPITVPQGFDLETFKVNVKSGIKINLPKNKPIIGYTGSLNYRLNYRLLDKVAKGHQNWNFVFIGSKQVNKLEDNLLKTNFWQRKLFKNPNVFVFKNQPKKNLPAIISSFNVCLIPYTNKVVFNKYCFPMKMFEYFFMGKPIISTPIMELNQFKPYVKIVDSADSMSNGIRRLMKEPWPKKYSEVEKKLAIQNSWDIKINIILKNIESRM